MTRLAQLPIHARQGATTPGYPRILAVTAAAALLAACGGTVIDGHDSGTVATGGSSGEGGTSATAGVPPGPYEPDVDVGERGGSIVPTTSAGAAPELYGVGGAGGEGGGTSGIDDGRAGNAGVSASGGAPGAGGEPQVAGGVEAPYEPEDAGAGGAAGRRSTELGGDPEHGRGGATGTGGAVGVGGAAGLGGDPPLAGGAPLPFEPDAGAAQDAGGPDR